MGLTSNSYGMFKCAQINISEILHQEHIKRKHEYIKFLCDCMYDDKLENVITFKEYCEVLDLEQRHNWEFTFNSMIEQNKEWY